MLERMQTKESWVRTKPAVTVTIQSLENQINGSQTPDVVTEFYSQVKCSSYSVPFLPMAA